jgi:hypothetical protein
MQLIATQPPPNKTRFVGIYGDMSGANLYKILHNGTLVDVYGKVLSDKPDEYLQNNGIEYWLPLPKFVTLWYEKQ